VVRFTLVYDTDNLIPSPMSNKYNWEKADWESFRNTLYTTMAKSTLTFNTLLQSATTDDLDNAALLLRDSIHQSLSLHVPLSKPCSRSKRWWTEELATMRQAMAKQHRKWKSTQLDTEHADYKRYRNKYFRAIRESRTNCWKNFLNSATNQDIFSAVKYIKPTQALKTPPLVFGEQCATDFGSKCQMFRDAMFPDPPASLFTFNIENTQADKSFSWPDITDSEVKDAIFKSAPHKAPGPDGINFLCLRHVY
jgi:hypothetical protein